MIKKACNNSLLYVILFIIIEVYIMAITKIGKKLLDDHEDDYDKNLVNAANTAVAASTILGVPSIYSFSKIDNDRMNYNKNKINKAFNNYMQHVSIFDLSGRRINTQLENKIKDIWRLKAYQKYMPKSYAASAAMAGLAIPAFLSNFKAYNSYMKNSGQETNKALDNISNALQYGGAGITGGYGIYSGIRDALKAEGKNFSKLKAFGRGALPHAVASALIGKVIPSVSDYIGRKYAE